jgi:fructose/tagatose bisphosphate aldolase
LALSNQTQNVTSSSTVVAALEAARDAKAPIILQTSQGGAAYFAGKVHTYPPISLNFWANMKI